MKFKNIHFSSFLQGMRTGWVALGSGSDLREKTDPDPTCVKKLVNLPGQPKAIKETLGGLRNNEGRVIAHGIFAAVPYCIDLIGGPYIDCRKDFCNAFRPKSAIKNKS